MTLNALEKQVFNFVSAAGRPVSIEELASGCFPQLDSKKANSWVRNSLRKLRDRDHVIEKTGRGTYAPVQPPILPPVVVTVAVEPVAQAPLVPILILRTPTQLSKQQFAAINKDNVTSIKRLDCSFYSTCLTEARDGDWVGFGCHQCSSYQALDVEQRVQDMLQLIAMDAAAENEEKNGCAGRKPGVRPGADARTRPRRQLKLVPANSEDVDEEEEQLLTVSK